MIRSCSLLTGPDSVFDSHFGASHFSAIPRIASLLFHSDGNRNSFNLCFSFASSSSSCSSYMTIHHRKTRENYVVASSASSDFVEFSSFGKYDNDSVHGVSETIVGVLGGGQLGRMLCQAVCQMAIKVIISDPLEDCPASSLSHDHVVGNFDDSAAVQEFAKRCGVLTVEIEHVDAETLEIVEHQGVDCQPKASTIRLIQDKYLQKVHFSQHAIPLPEFTQSKRLAYDGRGNAVAKREEDLYSAIIALGGFDRGLYVEKWAKFVKELSVIVVRGRDNLVLCYPVVETFHKENICHIVKAPANVTWEVRERATDVAFKAIRSLEGAGVFAVELFLVDDGQILLNEVAPRPHNSGHHTIESCYVSQYEQHLRAVLGLPLGDTSMKTGAAIKYNILGEDEGQPGFHLANKLMQKSLTIPGAFVHWYNKPEMRKQRKMGHVTIIGRSMKIGKDSLFSLLDEEIPEKHAVRPRVGIIMGSDSDYPVMKAAEEILRQFNVPYETKIVSTYCTRGWLFSYASSARERGLEIIIAGADGPAHLPGMVAAITSLPVIGVPVQTSALDGLDSLLSIVQMFRGDPVATVAINNSTNAGLLAIRTLGISDFDLCARMSQYLDDARNDVLTKADKLEKDDSSPGVRPRVGIIMGSNSDYPVMKTAAEILRQFNVPYEMKIVSAHRTPDWMFSYASSARERGLEIIIAGAGGAAHLPGMVAAITSLPVIGVPVRASALGGLDSLLSIVQMPRGVPVATVAINNSSYAGLLAVRTLGISDFDISASQRTYILCKMSQYLDDARNDVLAKADKLEKDDSSPGVRPRVGIIMGSDSDYPVMKTAAEILLQFNVPYEIQIVSAHRTPDWIFSYVSSARERGLEIIIAGAGGAAHLPGMVTAITSLPVIGVPVQTSALDGLESLLSIVQMFRGDPVATVAINNSTNAGLLVVRTLGISDFDLCARMSQYLDDARNDVLAKADKLEKDGSSSGVRPRVGVIMGSNSDYPVMKTAAEILLRFNVPYEMKIVSAHRTPDWMFSYASSACERGLEIIIAGAGGAAHLPGMVAALTPLPVIGVPVRASVLDGFDSLLSILQMPRGVPVATVGINNSTNAALLAGRMLGISDFDLCARKMILREQRSPDEKIEKDDFADYLENCTWNE